MARIILVLRPVFLAAFLGGGAALAQPAFEGAAFEVAAETAALDRAARLLSGSLRARRHAPRRTRFAE